MGTPAAGPNYFSGTSGDFYAVEVDWPDDTDYPALPSPLPTPVQVVEMSKWALGFNVTGAEFFGFNAPTDANGVVFPVPLKGGRGKWTATVEGAFNGDSEAGKGTFDRLRPGKGVYFHLIHHKSSGYGFRGCFGKVVSADPGADSGSTQASPVRLQIEGIGVLPDPSFAS
jgi:hypothetical protein